MGISYEKLIREFLFQTSMANSELETVEKLDQILRILVMLATKGSKQREQIAMLNRAGFQPKAIADLLGTSSNTVRVELVALRKEKRSGKPRRTS